MQPGSIEFRNHLSQNHPQQGGEPKANYLRRLARKFGITTARMNALYYDQRKDNVRFTTTEHSSIFGINPDVETKQQRLANSEEIDRIANQIIKDRVNEILATALRDAANNMARISS